MWPTAQNSRKKAHARKHPLSTRPVKKPCDEVGCLKPLIITCHETAQQLSSSFVFCEALAIESCLALCFIILFFPPFSSFLHNCGLWFLLCLHLQLHSWCQTWAFFSGPTQNWNQPTFLSSSANCTTDRADVQLHSVIGLSRQMNQSSSGVNGKHQKERQKTLCPNNPVMLGV